MVAAANTALSATADGNQKKPGFPGFIPPGANPQQVAAALAARTAPNVLAGTGLGMGDPMKQVAPIAPAVGGGLAPAFGSGLYGENARYNALPQDNAKNAGATAVGNVPALPAQPKPASAGVDGIPTGGPAGWAGGAAPQAPKTAFGDMQATIQNQVEKAVWGSNFTPAPSTGLPSAQKPAASPVSAPYRNEGQNYPAGGKAQSPAVTTAPAKPSKASGPANPTIGVASPFTAPTVGADGQVIALGSGKQIGGGVTRYDIPGHSTLYSNKTGSQEGVDDTLNMLNRRPVTPQNQAAMDASVARSEKQIADGVKLLQYKDQVAQAKAINAQPNPVDPRAAMDITSPQYQAARLQKMDMQQKSGESPAAYQTRMQAMVEGQRTAQAQASEEARLGLGRDTLAANTKQADAKLGIDQQRLGLDGQRLTNEQETGALTRDQKRMEMDQAKKIQALQEKYMTATGAEQEAIGKQLLTLSGKDPKASAKDNFMVVGGGQEWDAQANSMRNVPQRLIDLRTGLPVGGGAQSTQSASSGQKYEVGQTVQRADGQKARVTAVDANGQPTKFQPL
jgi:hypothetical protein